MTDEELRAEFASLRAELSTIRAHANGIPIIHSVLESLRQDNRMIRSAINDMARVNITAGEVEALHEDVNRMQTKQMELETRLSTLEDSK